MDFSVFFSKQIRDDSLRVGKVREKNIVIEEFKRRIQ